ncbi:MAG: GIY-YIG nuclease family protein [Candidatus Paceibacterota bacterium]|jgi:putative endonuclease
MPFVYILKSINHEKFYVGSTTDIDRRIFEHNSGSTTYTKRYMPWKVIYTEKYVNLSEARKREKYLKSSAGRKFTKTIPW